MNNKDYNPTRDGGVIAIRIYEEQESAFPKADLVFAFGGTKTITWTNTEERKIYLQGLDGYTAIFDERKHPTFDEYTKKNKAKASIIPDQENIGTGEYWFKWPKK